MRSNPVTIEVASGPSSPNSSPNSRSIPQPAWPGEEARVDREYILKPGESVADKIRKIYLSRCR